MKRYKPKFKVGDLVCMKEDIFHDNPAYKTSSIGRVESIHIRHGKGMFVSEDARGQINYSVSGFSLRPEQSQLRKYKHYEAV